MADRPWAARLSRLISEGGLRIDRDRAYGPDPRHMLDIYRSGKENPASPVILFYYGGGWTSGDRALYAFVGSALAANGVTTVVADYRLFPQVKYPAFCEDAALAYAWVHATVAEDGMRPVILMGHSAGAHIAALLTLDPTYRRNVADGLPGPSGFIGLSGPFGFDPTTWSSTKEIFSKAPSADSVRPVALAVAGGPPALIAHGAEDAIVEPVAAHAMAAALERAGTPVTKKVYPGVGHSGLIMTYAQPLRWRAPLLEDTLRFTATVARQTLTTSAAG